MASSGQNGEMVSVTATTRRRDHWFPLAILGLIILGATPFYYQSIPSCPGRSGCSIVGQFGWSVLIGTGLAPMFIAENAWVGVYWLCVISAGFLLILWFLHHRSTVRNSWAPALWALVVSVALLVFTIYEGALLPVDFTDRGFVGLVIIALGLVTFASLERSALLIVFALAFGALTFWACLYDISNLVSLSSSPGAEEFPNVILPGIMLMFGSACSYLLDRFRPLGLLRRR